MAERVLRSGPMTVPESDIEVLFWVSNNKTFDTFEVFCYNKSVVNCGNAAVSLKKAVFITLSRSTEYGQRPYRWSGLDSLHLRA